MSDKTTTVLCSIFFGLVVHVCTLFYSYYSNSLVTIELSDNESVTMQLSAEDEEKVQAYRASLIKEKLKVLHED